MSMWMTCLPSASLGQQGIKGSHSRLCAFRPAWEDREYNQLGLGQARAYFRDNRLDAGEHILSLIRGESLAWIVGVVGPDHQGDQLGGNTIQGTVLNTPKHVLGAVPGKSEVKHLAIRKGCLVVFLALPVVGDRVADHHQVKVALLRLSELLRCGAWA